MINSILTQVNILVHKKGFQITFLITLLYVIVTFVFYSIHLSGNDASNLYNPFINNALNSDSEFVWYFMTYYPFLVVLPAGFSLFNDNKLKITSVVATRNGKKQYLISKLASSFIVGFTVFFIPFLISLILSLIAYPLSADGTLTNSETYSTNYFDYASCYLFPELFHKNLLLYFIVSLLLFAVFSGIVSMFITSIAAFNIKIKIFLFLPFYFIIFIIDSIISPLFPNKNLYYGYYLTSYDATHNKSIWAFLIFIIALLLLTLLCSIRFIKKDIFD